MSEQNKGIVRQLFDAVNQQDMARVESLIAPGAVFHDTLPLPAPGWAGFKQMLQMLLAAFPDHRATIEAMAAEGDLVTVLHTHHGTHTGELMGIPPTGRSIRVEGLELVRIEGGRIAEFWRHDDDLGMLIQIGAVAPPGQPPR